MPDDIYWTAKHTASGEEIPVSRIEAEETPLLLEADVFASIEVGDPTGYWTNLLTPGVQITLERLGGEFTFPGVVEDVDVDSDAEGGDVLVIRLQHEAQVRLEGVPCDPYVYDEDGLDQTTRDAVFYSPWRFKPHTARGGSLDGDGSEPFLDGVTIKRAYEAALGVSHSWQLDFQDGRYFLPSQLRGDPNPEDASLLDVYQDEAGGDARPRLQRIRNGDGSFAAGDRIESIALMNGSPTNGAMGTPSTIEVILIGIGVTAQDPLLEMCRNALSPVRNYQAVTLTKTTNYLGSGLDAWIGTITLTGLSDDALAFAVTIPGTNGDATTTKVEYARIYATTVSDTGITAGVLEDVTAEGSLGLYVDDDFTGQTRRDMASAIQKATRSDPTINPGPHVDAYLDGELQAHLLNRRGADLSIPVQSIDNGDLSGIKRERVGRVVAHRVVAFGGGEGQGEVYLEDNADFDAGGLRHPENDPNGTARYGLLGKTIVYRDQAAASKPELRRRARGFAQLHEHPQDFYSARFTPRRPRVFSVGDSIPAQELKRGITGLIRVTERRFSWTPDGGEIWNIGLGHREPLPMETFNGQRRTIQQVNRNARQTTGASPVGGSGVHGDKTEYGRGTLIVPDGVEIERYKVRLRTVPWQAFAKSAAAAATGQPVYAFSEVVPPSTFDLDNHYDTAEFTRHYAQSIPVLDAIGADYAGVGSSLAVGNWSGASIQANLAILRTFGTRYGATDDASGNGRDLTEGTNASLVAYRTKWHGGLRCAGDVNDYVGRINAEWNLTGDLGAMVAFQRRSGSGQEDLVSLQGDGANDGTPPFVIDIDENDKLRAYHFYSTTQFAFMVTSTTISAGTRYAFYVERDVAAQEWNYRLFANGTLVEAGTVSWSAFGDPSGATGNVGLAIGEPRQTVAPAAYTPAILGGCGQTDILQARFWTANIPSGTGTGVDANLDEDDSPNLKEGNEFAFYGLQEQFALGQKALAQEINVAMADGVTLNTNSSDGIADDVLETDRITFLVSSLDNPFKTTTAVAGRIIETGVHITLTTVADHVHGLVYGIQTFKGDTPGSGPVLGSGIEVAFNPALNADGSPVNFDRDKVAGLAFGDPARSSEVLWDATNYLPTLPNGRPRPGAFPVLLKGSASANNAQGLFVVEVVGEPILKQEQGA